MKQLKILFQLYSPPPPDIRPGSAKIPPKTPWDLRWLGRGRAYKWQFMVQIYALNEEVGERTSQDE